MMGGLKERRRGGMYSFVGFVLGFLGWGSGNRALCN